VSEGTWSSLEKELAKAVRERDEARSEVERMRRLLDHATQANPGTSTLVMLMNESQSLVAAVNNLRLEVDRRDRGLVVCHEELRELGEESDRMETALRNALMLSHRIRKTDPESADHLVRFCLEAGVQGSVLRGDE